VKLLTRRRKRKNALADGTGAYDAAAVVPAIAEGRWQVPDRFNFASDVVEVLAQDPKRRALTFLGKDGVIQPRSFLRVAEGAARWAALLRENGVQPGDRVLVLAGSTVDWLEVMLAVMKVGAVSVPCPETMSAAAIGIRGSGSGAKLVVASEAAREELHRLADMPPVLYIEETGPLGASLPSEAPTHDTGARDPAFILTTSGLSAGPRGVVHTHGAAFASRLQAEYWLDAGPGDAVWCTADASTGSAVWNALLGPWSRGAEVVLHQGPFDPAERLGLLRRLDVTVLCQTPQEYEALLTAGDIAKHQPPRLRRLVSTGDHLSADVVAAFEKAWDLTICDGYGQVETGIFVANGAGPGYRLGSIGLPLPGYDVAVVDEQGSEVEPGEEGELALRGRPPTLFAGYWESPEDTKAAFRGDLYLTGDVAVGDDDGFLWFLGRAADVVLSGGRRFGPIEVEDALARHDAVAEAAVVGVRDLERGGQYARAFVVLAPGAEGSDRLAAELREHARHSLVDHKVPREIEFVDELPRTSDGKLKRFELRERPAAGLDPLWSAASAPALGREPLTVSEPEQEPEEPVFVEAAADPAPSPEPIVEEDVPPPPVFEDVAGPPDAFAEPEPRVEVASGTTARALGAPVPDPEFDARVETEPPAEPELEARSEPIVELVAEEPVAVEREPVVEEPEPAVESPVVEAPVLEAPVVEAIVEPLPDPAPDPLPDPEPEPEPPPAPEPEPVAEVLPLAPPAPEEAPEAEEDLPDFIVRPGSERQPDGGSADGDSTTLGFRPVSELVLRPPADAGTREETAESEPEQPRPRERPPSDRRSGKERRKRSSHEPGDEQEATDWMAGLSSRLSAYSLSEEPHGSAGSDEQDDDED
jgi:acyl-coenzyme A synthetase/AMP-(fatty) acid ligase